MRDDGGAEVVALHRVEGSIDAPQCDREARAALPVAGHVAAGRRVAATGPVRVEGMAERSTIRAGGGLTLAGPATGCELSCGAARTLRRDLADALGEGRPSSSRWSRRSVSPCRPDAPSPPCATRASPAWRAACAAPRPPGGARPGRPRPPPDRRRGRPAARRGVEIVVGGEPVAIDRPVRDPRVGIAAGRVEVASG